MLTEELTGSKVQLNRLDTMVYSEVFETKSFQISVILVNDYQDLGRFFFYINYNLPFGTQLLYLMTYHTFPMT